MQIPSPRILNADDSEITRTGIPIPDFNSEIFLIFNIILELCQYFMYYKEWN